MPVTFRNLRVVMAIGFYLNDMKIFGAFAVMVEYEIKMRWNCIV